MTEARKYELAINQFLKVGGSRSTMSIGRCYEALGDITKAKKYMLQSVELAANDVWIYESCARFFARRKEYQNADKYFQKAIPGI